MLLFFKYIIYFYLVFIVFWFFFFPLMYVYVRMSEALELELQTAVSCCVGAGFSGRTANALSGPHKWPYLILVMGTLPRAIKLLFISPEHYLLTLCGKLGFLTQRGQEVSSECSSAAGNAVTVSVLSTHSGNTVCESVLEDWECTSGTF